MHRFKALLFQVAFKQLCPGSLRDINRWSIVKVVILSDMCLLRVCPVEILSWVNTGSSTLKRVEEESEDCCTRPVLAGKLITGREADDCWLLRGLMPVTSAILPVCSGSKSSSVSSTWSSSSPVNTGSSSFSGSKLSS